MTIQNWTLTPECAAIFCDTLATGGADNSPSAFMSKAWIVPHLSIMIAALDWAYPGQTLYSHLAMGFAPAGSDELIQFATGKFRESAEALPNGQVNYPGAAVTMFIWDERRNEIDGWMFRAGCDFVGERMPGGGLCVLTPPTDVFAGKDWYGIAIEQQRADRERPPRHRDNLGGSLIGYEMRVDPSERPPSITITNFGKMPYFDEQAAQVAHFRSNCGMVEPSYIRT